MKEYAAYPITVSRTLSVNSRGYGSFLVAALRHLKSTQILSLPFFFGTTTIGDNKWPDLPVL